MFRRRRPLLRVAAGAAAQTWRVSMFERQAEGTQIEADQDERIISSNSSRTRPAAASPAATRRAAKLADD